MRGRVVVFCARCRDSRPVFTTGGAQLGVYVRQTSVCRCAHFYSSRSDKLKFVGHKARWEAQRDNLWSALTSQAFESGNQLRHSKKKRRSIKSDASSLSPNHRLKSV